MHSAATLWHHCFQLDITLEKGTLTLFGILTGSKSYGAEMLTVTDVAKNDAGDPSDTAARYNQHNSWCFEILEFADCVLKNKRGRHGDSFDALKTLELIHRIYRADLAWKKSHRLTDRVSRGAR